MVVHVFYIHCLPHIWINMNPYTYIKDQILCSYGYHLCRSYSGCLTSSSLFCNWEVLSLSCQYCLLQYRLPWGRISQGLDVLIIGESWAERLRYSTQVVSLPSQHFRTQSCASPTAWQKLTMSVLYHRSDFGHCALPHLMQLFASLAAICL